MKSLPYGKHFLDQKDINSVLKVLKSPYLTQGPKFMRLKDTL